MNVQTLVLVMAIGFSASAVGGSLSSDMPRTEGAVQGKVQLQDLDTNHDGMISKQEAKAKTELSKKFSELDKNKNGQLDEAEFARFEVDMKSDANKGQRVPSDSRDTHSRDPRDNNMSNEQRSTGTPDTDKKFGD